MKDVTYAELVQALNADSSPVIVVIDTLYHKKADVLAALAADAGVVPAVVRLGFNPQFGTMNRHFDRLAALPGKQVIFTDSYVKAVHWEHGFAGFQLVGEVQKRNFAEIQRQNDYVNSAPTKEIWHERAQEVLQEAGVGKVLNTMLEENRNIAQELDDKTARIIADQDEAAFEQLKQDYSRDNILKRLKRRLFGN